MTCRILSALIAFTLIAHAESTVGLPNVLRTNGGATLDALSMMQGLAKPSVVQFRAPNREIVQLGVVLSEDGYLLAKASELPNLATLTVCWSDAVESKARLARTDPALDLALLKTNRADCVPVNWAAPATIPQGEWVAAFSRPKDEPIGLRLGNVSACERAVPSRGAAMGIEMKDTDGHDAVRVVDVAAQSPAEVAGLKPDDLIVSVDDLHVSGVVSVHDQLANRHPGDSVKLRVSRAGGEHDIAIRLASKSKILSNWTGEDYANGGVSLRTDGFPRAIQFQMPVSPHDMGGPLLNLDGKAIGITMARVDRVTTFALPVGTFWSAVQQWMAEDRNARPAPVVR